MNARVCQKLACRKRRIQKHLDKSDLRGCAKPMFTAGNIQLGERGRGIGYGGIGAMHLLGFRCKVIYPRVGLPCR